MSWVFDLKESSSYGASATIGLADVRPDSRNTVAHMRGEFCGYNIDSKGAFLFRDRVGGRSLYYSVKGNKLHIAQDPAWIAKRIKSGINERYIREEYMTYQIPLSHETPYQDVYRVMPGEVVDITRSYKVTRKPYWKLANHFGNEPFDSKKFLDLLQDAVSFRRNLVNNKITAYLSGGLDSSSIVCLAEPKQVFSGIYSDEEFSELSYMVPVVSKIGCTHTRVEITQKEFHSLMPELPNILPDSMCGLGIIPQVIVAREAAKAGFEWAYTGEGGDEALSGYVWNTLVFVIADALRSLRKNKYMDRYDSMIEKGLAECLPAFIGILIKRDSKFESAKAVVDAWIPDLCVEDNVMNLNISIGLPAINYVDEQVGRYTGVTPVSPLCDHRVIEYIANTAPRERTNVPKAMLRAAMEGILPEKVRTRSCKMGFPVCAHKWQWPMLKDALLSLEKRNIIDVNMNSAKTLDRTSWAYYNIEGIANELDQ